MSGLARSVDGWVHRSPDGRQFHIRAARSLEDLELCIGLQKRTWGYSDIEVVPRNIYVLAQALGGHVLCAWDAAEQFAGFAMAIAAHEPPVGSSARGACQEAWMAPVGRRTPLQSADVQSADAQPIPVPYLHSHLLAIAPEHQRCGLGFALKFAQRDLALACGIRTMRWTFDPLMARNAAFNLGKLRATVRRYIPDFYGRLASVLQGGTPTDRFLAEWDLDSDRVQAAFEVRSEPPAADERIALNAEIPEWKAAGAIDRLEAVQCELRDRFLKAFARGMRLQDFVPDTNGGGEYLLQSSGTVHFCTTARYPDRAQPVGVRD